MPVLQILQQHCPAEAVGYCYQLWQKTPFLFKLKKERSSKLGDYRYNPHSSNPHQISINYTLNQYAFVITYVHEVAHLYTFTRYKRKVLPHGKEWKRIFTQLMMPVLNEQVFPTTILMPLQEYMRNPKASSCSDMKLFSALHVYNSTSKPLLADLSAGEAFVLGGRIFEKVALRRTRVLCKERSTGKQFTISVQAPVERINEL